MDEQTQEGTGTQEAEGQESSVIRELRSQLKVAQEKAKLADEMRASAAEAALTSAGFPKLKDLYLERVQDAMPTSESVSQFLEGLGLEPQTQAAQPASDEGEAPPAPAADVQAIDRLTDLGRQVAAAAGGAGQGPSVEKRLAEAQSAEEIAAIMREAGATISI